MALKERIDALPWWRTAPNPPCMPGCDCVHRPNEFTEGASLMCTRTVARTPMFVVEVQQLHTGEDDKSITSDPPTVYLDLRHNSGEDWLTPGQAENLGQELHMALSKAAAIIRGAA